MTIETNVTAGLETLEFGKAPTSKSPVKFAPFHIADLDWQLDGETLTIMKDGDSFRVDPLGLAYVIQYGLQQSLTDSFANAISFGKAAPKFVARLGKIIKGEMSLAGTATGDPVRAEMKRLAIGLMTKAAGKSETALRKELDKAWSRTVNETVAKFEASLRAAAERIVESKRAEAEMLASIAAAAEEELDGEQDETEGAGETETEGSTPAEPEQPKVEPKKSRRKAA